MLLQLLLGHGAGLAVQIRQGPALDGRDAIAPQLFVHAQICPMIAVAQQRADELGLLLAVHIVFSFLLTFNT